LLADTEENYSCGVLRASCHSPLERLARGVPRIKFKARFLGLQDVCWNFLSMKIVSFHSEAAFAPSGGCFSALAVDRSRSTAAAAAAEV